MPLACVAKKIPETNTQSQSNISDTHRPPAFGVQSGAIAFAWVTHASSST